MKCKVSKDLLVGGTGALREVNNVFFYVLIAASFVLHLLLFRKFKIWLSCLHTLDRPWLPWQCHGSHGTAMAAMAVFVIVFWQHCACCVELN